MSSIADLIRKQYEKESPKGLEEKKVGGERRKPKKGIVETERMKRISLWLDKETYHEIQRLASALREDSMARAYANESELIRSVIRKGLPEVLKEFKRMFPGLDSQQSE